jgi:MFS family permease
MMSGVAVAAVGEYAVRAGEAVLMPLDRLRLALLRALGPVGRCLVRDRELRVGLAGSIAVLTALAGSLLVPWWMLALGPALIGVPHILADVRYLVTRPGLHRRWSFWLLVGVPVVATAFGAGMRAGGLALVGASLAARGAGWGWRGVALLGGVGLAACGFVWPYWTDLAFAHGHNLIAVLLWWAWRPRRAGWHFIPIALFLGALAVLFFAPIDGLYRRAFFWWAPTGLDAHVQVPWLAWGLPGDLAVRATLSFAFAQAVHYAVWLRLVPEDDRGRDTPRSWAASLRALREDVGLPLLLLAALAAFTFATWALFDLAAARNTYLRVGLFHGHMELAAYAWVMLERRRW